MSAARASVARTMLSFDRDGDGWFAWLDCGHRRHIHHRPPLSSYPWIDDPDTRATHVGEPIECGRCVQRVWPDIWPDALERTRETRLFTQDTVPAGLLGEHTTAKQTWGRLEVETGQLTLCFAAPLDERVIVRAGEWAAIPPELVHHVELGGPVEFRVGFYRRTTP